MTTTEQVFTSARDRVIDGLKAVEHDLRWENQGQAAAQIAALTDRFERDTK